MDLAVHFSCPPNLFDEFETVSAAELLHTCAELERETAALRSLATERQHR
jgi:hypothetical protein